MVSAITGTSVRHGRNAQAQRQILLQGLAKGVHRAPPGHAKARARSASTSIVA
jgi:hypothetical protein